SAAILRLDPSPAADVRGLGAVLYAALTGRWPLPGWSGLPPVDRRSAVELRPRLVRAGIPRDVDEVTRRALSGEYADPHRLERALSALPAATLDGEQPRVSSLRSDSVRRWLWRIVPPVAVLAVAV